MNRDPNESQAVEIVSLASDDISPQLSQKRVSAAYRTMFWIFLANALYVGLVYFVCANFENWNYRGLFEVFARWPNQGEPTMETHFSCWDAAHYLILSTRGYEKGTPGCAFYPVWPFSIRAFSSVTGASPVVIGLVLSNLYLAIAFGLLFEDVQKLFGRRVAVLSLIYMYALPGALFFHFPYSESAFLLALVVFVRLLHAGSFLWAAAIGILLPTMRPVGTFLAIPIAIALITDAIRHFKNKDLGIHKSLKGHVIVLGGVAAGFLLYLVLMFFLTGSFFEGFYAQQWWGVHSARNYVDLIAFTRELFAPTTIHEYAGSVLDRLLFLISLAVLPSTIVYSRYSIGLFVALVLLPAMSAHYISLTRYSVLFFPMAIGIARIVAARRTNRWAVLSLLAMALIQSILLWRFVNMRWAG
jgi:hypothetical protein